MNVDLKSIPSANPGAPLVLKLWPSVPPDSIESPAYVEEAVKTGEGEGTRISKVSTPILEVYLPSNNITPTSAVVICPGGAYSYLTYDKEGVDVAKWFCQQGIAGIVLKYRLPSDAIMKDKSVGPLQDVQEAIRFVRRNARPWSINPEKIGIMGFSAGGHLAASASTLYDQKPYVSIDSVSARPDFSIIIYPVISMNTDIAHMKSRQNLIGLHPSPETINRFSAEAQVNRSTPPTFLVHSEDDSVVSVKNAVQYFLKLEEQRVPAEMHIYPRGDHGYGLGVTPASPKSWPDSLKIWMRDNKFS